MLSVFQFDSQNVRVLIINNEPWFVLADILAAFGSKSDPYHVKNSLLGTFGEGAFAKRPLIDSRGIEQDTTIIPEFAVTFLVANSRTELGRSMNRWLHKDVLPSIRKTGKYNPSSVTQPQLPQNYLEALKALVVAEEEKAALQGEKIALQKEVKVLAPKADTADRFILRSNDTCTFTFVAGKLGTSAIKLKKLCRDMRIFNKSCGLDTPRVMYVDWFSYKSVECADGKFRQQLYVTPLGQTKLTELWQENQIEGAE